MRIFSHLAWILPLIAVLGGCNESIAVPTPAPTLLAKTSNAELLKQALGNMKALRSYEVTYGGGNYYSGFDTTADIDVARQRSLFLYGQSALGGTSNRSITLFISRTVYYCGDGGSGAGYSSDEIQRSIKQGTFYSYDYSKFPFPDGRYEPAWDGIDIGDNDIGKLHDANPAIDNVGSINAKHLIIDDKYLPMYTAAYGSVITSSAEFWLTPSSKPMLLKLSYHYTYKSNNPKAPNGYDYDIRWSRFNENFNIQPPSHQTAGSDDTNDEYCTP